MKYLGYSTRLDLSLPSSWIAKCLLRI